MNITTNVTRYIILSMLALSAIGCGDPCLPTIGVDTLIAPAEMCVPPESSTTAMDTTTGGGGGLCEVVPLTCTAQPLAMGTWGPCGPNGECSGANNVCSQTDKGNVCVPVCGNDCDCGQTQECFGGTCTSSSLCAAPCKDVGDTCPAVGMICDTVAKQCVYAPPDECAGPDVGKVWWPCDNGACADGSACIDSGTAWICAPVCKDDVCGADPFICESDAANTPTCGTATTCHYDCAAITECAQGQVCDASLGQCMWPK